MPTPTPSVFLSAVFAVFLGATSLAALPLPPPPHIRGHSLRPLLNNTAERIRDEIFAEVTFHAAYEPMRCIRTERYKLIRRYGMRSPIPANCDDSPSKDVWIAGDGFDLILASTELYDLLLDPQETNNLVDSTALIDTRHDLEARLNRWMADTDDPLLQGLVTRPSGAVVNSPEAISPTSGPFEPVL